MRLCHLELTDYRCYEKAQLSFPAGITVISGRNAQGKTNLLESVFLCCAGKSHRGAKEEEMIRMDTRFSFVKAHFTRGDVAHDIAITLRRGGRKRILLDGAAVRRTADFVGQMQAVLFSPENIMLIKDAPARRRTYMDVALSQVYKSYLRALMDYNRALLMRNTLLKDGQQNASFLDMLDVFDEQIASCGAAVMRARRQFCMEAAPLAAEIQHRISAGQDELSIRYAPCVACDPGQERDAIVESCKKQRTRDIQRRTTSMGPHRDDMELCINGMQARLYASQGQQRTAALSIKMAELFFMRTHTGNRPILLLDDVFGELDAARRAQLLTAVGDCQTIITCTNIEALPLDKTRIDAMYAVENAVVNRQ
jgi:DNA replication and repair protein RecF